MRDEQTCLEPRVGSSKFPRLVRSGWIGLAVWAFGALGAGPAVAASADFVLTSPASPAYYAYGALAGRKVQLKGTVEVVGNVHSNDQVHLQNGSRVTGNVSASGTVQNQGTVTGTVRSGAPQVALPALQSEAELRALADRVMNGPVTLENATIDDVLFVQGDVEIRGTLRGTGTIIAIGQIVLKEVSSSTLPPASERISLIAKKDVKFQKGRAFRGAIYAAGDVDVQKDSKLAGVLIAGRDLTIDKNTRLDFNRVDAVAPSIRLLAPLAGSTVADPRQRIEVGLSD
ncbi:MAG TPA: polymer-forming cytoskeletal protein, partial [Thermoanaerobaculia bacterium]|nr:polymer-forming cytoskeletal protein [Thermoanaerobaculia bacterium]